MNAKSIKTIWFLVRKRRIILLGTALMLLLFFLVTAAMVHHALQPLNKSGENKIFEVKEGTTLNQIAVDLEKADIIPSSTVFRL